MKQKAIFIVLLIVLSLLVSCVNQPTQTTRDTSPSAAPTDKANEPGTVEPPEENTLTGTLTYWAQFENNAAKSVSSYAELPLYEELKERLGITIEFQHPPTGMEADQFKLLVSSKTLPDIIEYDWFSQYPQGPQKALDDGVIIALNQYIEAGKTPNLTKVLAGDPVLDGTVKTYTGNYYVFPSIRDEGLMEQKGGGLTIRKDVLDTLGLEMPETIDDWYIALGKMKELGFETPFTGTIGSVQNDDQCFVGAYGIGYNFYHIDGKVMFGQIQPEYKEYLATMRKWYGEGLIDPDIITNTTADLDGKMTGGKAAVTDRSPDSGIGVWTTTMRKENPDVVLAAAPFPTLVKGETRYYSNPNYRYQATFSAAITSECKNVDLALKLLDYGYSEEGKLLYNFGIEGESFEYIDGEPQFTDLIKKNPNGLTLKEAMILYGRNSSGGPFEKALGPILSQRTYQDQLDAPIIWFKSVDWSRSLPRLVYSNDEASELADIMNEINVLSEEMSIKIMIGDKPLDDFDSYVENIKKANIERAIEIVETAFVRQTNN